uniref:SRP54 domain-containing protein n=1 Tax=Panagrellus redivivus TaxID=6233 RepID=A0A7E4VXQ4_PANRE
MIELFTIFGKGGLVLWYFSEGGNLFKGAVNDLIANVLLQERNVTSFPHDGMTVKYKLDNELDIVILVVYQSIIQLAYADKLLSEVQLRFRDLYKNAIESGLLLSSGPKVFKNFDGEYNRILKSMKAAANKPADIVKPRTFQESAKSKKTVASLIENPKAAEKEKENNKSKAAVPPPKTTSPPTSPQSERSNAQSDEDEEVARNLEKLRKRAAGGDKATSPKVTKEKAAAKKGKQPRKWENGGKASDAAVLDYSSPNQNGDIDTTTESREDNFAEQHRHLIGKCAGELQGIDEQEDFLPEDESEEEYESTVQAAPQQKSWFSAFKSLVSNKQLTAADIAPVMEKMKDTLTSKNVAAEPAEKICESVAAKLDGKVIGSFSRVATIVKEAMRESLVQLLTPKRRVDILRDIKQAKSEKRPYVVVFCGVNGVGKSTNLAKITFWLNENNNRVLIAAGDTFRAGAVEQLRTHTRHLNNLHPNSVQLYEQGYGKDPAGLAASAIQIAIERQIDVVLVDTAGRMQDNEPLMRALSKLIRVNEPDLVLFVGEALVGNEAVDQLVKFNQALADHSDRDATPRLIDGIVLTKFDTIDDKVGAAVSMTYITGQPIVFVGTGQTYSDLKSLNVNAVVNSLLK